MNRVWKVLTFILIAAVAAAAGGLGYLFIKFPDAGDVPTLTVDMTQDRIERGRYLANHVAVCIDCHSQRDFSFFAGPIIPGTEGGGGEHFPAEAGFPGDLYSKNITPSKSGLGDWNDGQIFHAITAGVTAEGKALFPLMPYPHYGSSDREDILDVIAYLKSLQPIENAIPETRLKFPVNLIVRTLPTAPTFVTRPPTSDTVAYGRYLTRLAACAECHTPAEKGKPLPGMDFAGGFEFRMPWGTSRSANITPDIETGIGTWSREQFVTKFKTFSLDIAKRIPVKPPLNETNYQTLMPWISYAGMTEEDLSAIYAYLRTLPAVKNKVQKFSAADGAVY